MKSKSKKNAPGWHMPTAEEIERVRLPETDNRWLTILRDDDSGDYEETIHLSPARYVALKDAAAAAGKPILRFLWDSAMPRPIKRARKQGAA